jgi:glycosyltransferase involved in cell wall biosynthesis
MPLISVIIPAYNREKTLEICVKSILNQTYTDLEVIIVDDASTDRTVEIAHQLVKSDHRVRCLRHSSNLKAQAARNTGIKSAKGNWIAFLDSDDQWLPDSLELRFNLANSANVKVVYSECYVIRPDSPQEHWGMVPLSGNIYRHILQQPGPMFQSLLVAREALERIGFLDESIMTYQEWETSIRLSKHYEFAFVETPTFIYDCRGSDTMSKNMLKDAEGYRQILKKHFLEIVKHLGLPGLARHYQVLASRYQLAGETGQALKYKLSSVVSWPFRASILARVLRGGSHP